MAEVNFEQFGFNGALSSPSSLSDSLDYDTFELQEDSGDLDFNVGTEKKDEMHLVEGLTTEILALVIKMLTNFDACTNQEFNTLKSRNLLFPRIPLTVFSEELQRRSPSGVASV